MKLKRIMAIVLSFAMVLSTTSLSVFAADNTVTNETELATALAAGGTVTLGNDIEVATQIVIPEGAEATLDLAGHKIIGGWANVEAKKHIYVLKNNGMLTIKDSGKEGAIVSRGVYNYGSLTLESGTIDACDGDGGYAVNNEAGSAFTMNGGVLTASYEDGDAPGNGYDATALDVPANSEATLNGGIITDDANYTFAIVVSGGELNVPKTSTVSVTGVHGAVSVSAGTANIDGGKFKLLGTEKTTDSLIYVSGGEAHITGGEFDASETKSESGRIIGAYDNAKVTVDGGTFTSNSWFDFADSSIENVIVNSATFVNCDDTVKSYVAEGASITLNGEEYINASTPEVTYVATVNGVECADASAMISALNSASGDVTVEIYGKVVTNGFGLNNSNITKLSFVAKSDDAEICVDGISYIDVRYTKYPIEYTGLILSHINAGQNIDGYLPQYFSTYNGSNVTYNECTFPNGVTACGSVANTTYTFTNCIFNNTTSGLYSLWIYGNSTNVVVNGGEFCGVRGIKLYSEGSNDFSSLSVSGATFSDTITEKHAVVLTKGESVTLTNNTFNNTKGTVQVDDDYASSIDGKTVTIDGKEYIVDSDNLTLEESTPAVTVAEVNGEPYTSLQAALDAAAAGKGNVTVEILSNVDLTGVDWNPVSVSAPNYPVVTVNGNDKTITGLNDMLFSGTWAGDSGLIINDLTIKDSTIEHDVEDTAGNIAVGAFIGYPQASAVVTLNNCHLLDSTVSGGHWTGGLVGASAGYSGTDGPVFLTLTISNCSVKGSTITGKGSVGGIIGHGTQSPWTQVNITDTIVSDNDIISTGSSINKAGSIMGTIGAAGETTETNGVTKTGGISVDAETSKNEVTSGGTKITTIYGRQGTPTGMLYVSGGTYEANPIEENVSYAAPAEGYEIKENADGTWGVEAAKVASITDNGTTTYYPSLDAALAAATSGQTVELVADEITVDTIVIPSGVVVKMNGGKFTANKVTNNGEFNIYGESTLDITTASGNTIDFYNGAVISDTKIGGTVTVISKITFLGDNVFGMLNDYGAAYSGSDPGASWTVEPGATVTLTNAGRYGLGYGDNTIIKGTISDALTARETLTEEDAAFFTNGVALMCSWDEDNYLSVENAYVILGSNNSFGTKADYGKKGKFHISFNNAVMDSSRITNDAAAGTADFTFNKSDIKVGAWSDKSTASTVKFTDSKMLVTGNGTDWNNENAGSMTLENTDIVFESGAFTNSGNITLDINSSIVTPQLAGAGTITIDAEGFDPEQEIVLVQADMSGFTGTINVINNAAAAYKIEDDKIILNVVEEAPELKDIILGGNVDLESSLVINFFIDPTLVIDTDVVVIEHVHADGSVSTVRQTISECRNNVASGYPRAKIDSIAAKEMADTIKVTVYNAQGDQTGYEITYSIRDYAMTQLSMTEDTELKTVLVDMLNYGTAAQQYFNYNTGDYANSLLTEEQKALATTEYVATKDGQIVGTNAAGRTVSLESSITLSAFFTGNGDSTEGMYATAKFTDHYGNEKTENITSFRVMSGYIVVDVNSLAVADMNQLVEITLYNVDGSEYGSCTTSVGSYVVDNSNNPAAVALAKFATSAKSYFSKH